MRHRLRSAICIVVAALAGTVALSSGCSNQGEGERCTFFGTTGSASVNGSQPTDGTQDCQDGLVCTPSTDFPPSSGTYDRCCPMDLANATVEACRSGNAFNGNPTAGRDAGIDDDGMDATSDGKDEDAKKADAKTADVEEKDAEKKDAEKTDADKVDAEKSDAEKDGNADSSSSD